MSKKLTINEFLVRCEKVHGVLYDYSAVNLINVYVPVIIICRKPEHGQFSQTTRNHMLGAGCPKCGILKRASTRLGIMPGAYDEAIRNGQRYCTVHGFQSDDKYYNYKSVKHDKIAAYHVCKECSEECSRRAQRELRLEVLSNYSPDISCAICGEKHLEFLALDHINGGGSCHRKEIKNKRTIYSDLKRKGFPSGYRVLCHNCNFKYYINKAYHKPESELKDKRKARNQKLKYEAINYYSDGLIVCVCSGCTCNDLDVLSIDHIDGGGGIHSNQLKSQGKRFGYQWLKTQGYPPGYRVLCLNCNMARGFYGHCPHEAQ